MVLRSVGMWPTSKAQFERDCRHDSSLVRAVRGPLPLSSRASWSEPVLSPKTANAAWVKSLPHWISVSTKTRNSQKVWCLELRTSMSRCAAISLLNSMTKNSTVVED